MAPSAVSRRAPAPAAVAWSHAPSTLTLAWMAISLPLVAWDTGYVLLRPHTMPGGALHEPLYTPYALYGQVDHVYGFKQWEAHNGFTAAQGALNLVETLMYAFYLWVWATRAKAATAAGGRARKAVGGRAGASAILVGFAAAVMTLSKTVLYWLNEYYSGFDNIGHNTPWDLVFLWIIPNGLWLVFPTFMIYELGAQIVDGLAVSSSGRNAKSE